MKMITGLMAFLALTACVEQNKGKGSSEDPEFSSVNSKGKSITLEDQDKLRTAYFASGCFWCVEAIYESVTGVTDVVSGYSGGKESDPTYEAVSYGRTTHAEAVKVTYDPDKVSFGTLVDVFFGSHDPTTLNRQGPDKGAQYRSVAFYQNEEEKRIIDSKINALNRIKAFSSPIVTQVVAFDRFYMAEEYHQDFERRNPYHPYIQNVSIPRLNRFKKKFPHLLKEENH